MPGQEADEDLFLLAKLIGIQPDEPEYFWIAKEAYNADLPGGWEIFFDEDGKPFYFDVKSQKTTYEHPSIDFYRLLYRELREKDKLERERLEAQELIFGKGIASSKALNDSSNTKEQKDDEVSEVSNRAKLLQAFSHDPELAAKYRDEAMEQESRAAQILKSAMRKEEEIFMRRLKLYTSHRNDSILKPLQEHIVQQAAAQNGRLEDALKQISAVLQVQTPPERKSGTVDMRAELLRRNRRPSGPEEVKPEETIKKLQEEVSKLQEDKTSLLSKVQELQSSVKTTAAAPPVQAMTADQASLQELKTELENATNRAKLLEKENHALKAAYAELKASASQSANNVDDEMDRLSQLAARLDADSSVPVGNASENLEFKEPTAPPAGSDIAQIQDMSEETLLRALERLEMLSGNRQGPVSNMKARIAELEGNVKELEEEKAQVLAHSKFVEDLNTDHLRSLARFQALEQELQRAKDHSESMEFLAKQYSDQLINLNATMKRLREEVIAEQPMRVPNSNGHVSSAQSSAVQAKSVKAGGDGPQVLKLIVRVRSSTLLDVKRGSSALRTAVNLLKTDFLAYAEGIFLPISRQLQRQTLYLASTLSVKSRELRMVSSSLSCSLTAQKLLEEKLSAIYSVPFHSACYLRPCGESEKTAFRPIQATQLTMQLRDGFENKRGLYETYDFDKVFAQDSEVESIFHELLPYISRVLNWKPFCLIAKGGRQSDKMSIFMGRYQKNELGQLMYSPGLIEHIVQFMTHFFSSEKDKLLKERLQEEYDLQLYLDFVEVYEENVTNYTTSAASANNAGESVSLRDVQNAFLSQKIVDVAALEQAENSEEDENEEKKATSEEIGIQNSLPAYKIGKTEEAVKFVNECYQRSQAKLKMKQDALNRNASDSVQRGKRLAVSGSRNELGELVQEPHYLVSLMVEKRHKATDERDFGLLRVLLLGSPAEYENTADARSALCFREEKDASSEAITDFLGKKWIRSNDTDAVLPESKLSSLVSDVLTDSRSSSVLITAISPNPDHFDVTVRDLRYACKESKCRPTTAIRLERVKFRWSNQSLVWAFTLWKGALADTVQIQQSNTIANLQEEIAELKTECKTLRQQLEKMATDGVAYSSAVESEEASDDELREDADAFRAQQKLLEKTMKKELARNKDKADGALLQAVAARLQYAQSQYRSAVSKNRSLAEVIRREKWAGKGEIRRTLSSSAHMPEIRSRNNDLSSASTRSALTGSMPSHPGPASSSPSPIIFVKDKKQASRSLSETTSVLSSVRYAASLDPTPVNVVSSGFASYQDSSSRMELADLLPRSKRKPFQP